MTPPLGFGASHAHRHIRLVSAVNRAAAAAAVMWQVGMSALHVSRVPARSPAGTSVGRSTPVMAGIPVFRLAAVWARRLVPPAIPADVGIELVRLPGVAGYVAAQGLRLMGPLLGFLPKARRVDLCLFGVGACPSGLGFPLAGVDFHVLGFTPDLCRLFPVLLVPLLLEGLPALSAGQKEHHDQCNDNDGNYHPNPWSCIHVSHHFPLRCDRAGPRHSG